MPTPCSFVKADGTACAAPAMEGDGRCYFHSENPEVVASRKLASHKGGSARTPLDIDGLKATRALTRDEAARLVAGATQAVLDGRLDATRLRGVLYGVQILGGLERDRQLDQLAERLDKLEETKNEKRG